jgi:hypothetical protein
MKTDNLTAKEAELLLLNGYKVQPMSWSGTDHILSVEGLHYGDESPYRIYTTDEDVAKWSDRQATTNYFEDKKPAAKQYWREQYAAHLTTLPELTDSVVKENFTTDPSATVSDDIIGEWYNSKTSSERWSLLCKYALFQYLHDGEKQKVRQAYHKAHEKVEQNVNRNSFEKLPLEQKRSIIRNESYCHGNCLTTDEVQKVNEWIEAKKACEFLAKSAPQAYKFPYNNVLFDDVNKVLIFSEEGQVKAFKVSMSDDEIRYICEAINEKRQRDEK